MPGALPHKLDCLAQERRGSGTGAGRLWARTGEERPRAEKVRIRGRARVSKDQVRVRSELSRGGDLRKIGSVGTEPTLRGGSGGDLIARVMGSAPGSSRARQDHSPQG